MLGPCFSLRYSTHLNWFCVHTKYPDGQDFVAPAQLVAQRLVALYSGSSYQQLHSLPTPRVLSTTHLFRWVSSEESQWRFPSTLLSYAESCSFHSRSAEIETTQSCMHRQKSALWLLPCLAKMDQSVVLRLECYWSCFQSVCGDQIKVSHLHPTWQLSPQQLIYCLPLLLFPFPLSSY